MAVARWIVSDALWKRVEPLLPRRERRFRYSGRKRLPEREALQGILFVLHTGSRGGICRWRSASARARPATAAFPNGRKRASGCACTRCSSPSCRPPAGLWRTRATYRRKRGSETGPSPVDRGRNGSKHHLLVDATGIPLAWTVSGGNRNDITQVIPLVERVPPVRGTLGRPRRRPERVTADRGYDHDKYRRELRQRRIKPEIARRQTEHGSGLGRARWVVERTFAWLHQFKRLLVRYDRRAEIHEAFLALGCCSVCFRRLARSF
jgi:transposase